MTGDCPVEKQDSSPRPMSEATIARLLELNRQFYATVSAEFDKSRQGIPQGMVRALDSMPSSRDGDQSPQASPGMVQAMEQMPTCRDERIRIVDVGCGNGRLARALDRSGAPFDYVGVDQDARLLALAAEQTAALRNATVRLVQTDLAAPSWHEDLPAGRFDVAFCLATIHHFPGWALRQRIVSDLARLTPGGCVILSTWQFRNSARLTARIQPWSAIGLAQSEVEEGDALLPWDQGVHALRYVHLVGLDEIERFARFCNLEVRASFEADGAEGNLNLYAVLGQRANGEQTRSVQ